MQITVSDPAAAQASGALGRVALRCGIAICAVLALLSNQAHGQARPIEVCMPGNGGGSLDILTRQVMLRLSQVNGGRPAIVLNIPGASGTIAIDRCIRQPATGDFYLMGYTSNILAAQHLYPKLAYDPYKDLRPVTLLGSIPYFILVPANSKFTTLQSLLAYIKANPGKVNFGSGGIGAGGHLGGEMLSLAAGSKMVHIPFAGASAAGIALLGGHVDLVVEGVSGTIAHVKGGKMRALAVTAGDRVAVAPDVPTVTELGYPQLQLSTWIGVFMRADTPDAIVARASGELNKALDMPAVRQGFAELGARVEGGSPQSFSEFVASQRMTYDVLMQQIENSR